jgi:RimJ/RimL family protein N-acetyltransferase
MQRAHSLTASDGTRPNATAADRGGTETGHLPVRANTLYQRGSSGNDGVVDGGSESSFELRGKQVVLVPVIAQHVPELRRILRTPEVRLRWGDEDASQEWPFDDPSATRFSILLDGAVRGMVQYSEEEEPRYRHASVDIFLEPAVHGRGVGRDAVRVLAGHLVHDRGHHHLLIDPAVDNEPAIRCYTAVGFRPVGVLRCYERDADGRGWHDGLLMDLLAEEL